MTIPSVIAEKASLKSSSYFKASTPANTIGGIALSIKATLYGKEVSPKIFKKTKINRGTKNIFIKSAEKSVL